MAHDHHHHHDHDCGCGHDHHEHHHHEHHHHHGEECTDPSCSCHHDHGEKNTHSCFGGTITLESHIHEGAVACAVSAQWPALNRGQEEQTLLSAMGAVAAWVTSQGGFVGHIKSSMEYTERTGFSLTLQEPEAIPGISSVRIELAAIVFGVAEADLQRTILEAFRKQGNI